MECTYLGNFDIFVIMHGLMVMIEMIHTDILGTSLSHFDVFSRNHVNL